MTLTLWIFTQQKASLPPWLPLVGEEFDHVTAEFSTAQAVIAGQGQTVRVSGVRIGDIGKVRLVNGRAVVEMVIDPEYKGMIRTDAHALLRPRTGLKDMFIEVDPGSDRAPAATAGYTLPISATPTPNRRDSSVGTQFRIAKSQRLASPMAA